jgi:hypothetical protein
LTISDQPQSARPLGDQHRAIGKPCHAPWVF